MKTALLAAIPALAVADWQAPQVVVDLDAAPETRWDDAIKTVIDTHGWDGSYGNVVTFLHDLIPDSVYDVIEPLMEDLTPAFGEEYAAEVQGVWQSLVNHGGEGLIELGDVTALNFIYEFTCGCTSITAQPSAASPESCPGPISGRNLDYGIPGLTNMTVNVDFQSGGETQYSGVAFVGYVGLLTAVRPNGFSITIDQMEGNPNGTTIAEFVEGAARNVASGLAGGDVVGQLIRDAVATQPDYSSALDFLVDTRTIAREFLIVTGTQENEGAVLTRNRVGVDDTAGEGVWALDDSQADAWWRLETNWPHWKPQGDGRADAGNKMMAAIGPDDITRDGVLSVLSTDPVLNSDTQYTSVMCPATGELATTVRG